MTKIFALVLVFSIPISNADAQFIAPLPQPLSQSDVRLEDYRTGFVASLSKKETTDLVQKSLSAEDFEKKRADYCGRLPEAERQACGKGLTVDAVVPYALGSEKPITDVILSPSFPFTHSRAALANYMMRSNTNTGLSVLTQFAANVSDDEMFVVSNVVRGLAGRSIFSLDHAAVVAKAEAENQEKRKELESDKSTLIRMVNNGGTLVGKFYAPIFAESGATVSSTAGLQIGAGLIGALGQTETLHAAGTAVLEYQGSLAIRDIAGSGQQAAELLIGTRLGYSRSDAPLLQSGGPRGVRFGQLGVGLRRNGELALSVLISKTESQYRKLVPQLQVNFSAVR